MYRTRSAQLISPEDTLDEFVPRTNTSTLVTIPGPTGMLEATVVDGSLPGARAVLCHPHPLFGGTMQNKVVVSLAKMFVELGFTVLRFNYRGVGASEGAYDEGRGETLDALAAIDWLTERTGSHGPLWVGGFSFGTYVSLGAAARRHLDGLISVAPAVNLFNFRELETPTCPWLVIQGDQDELVPVDAVMTWSSTLPKRPTLVRLKGASHFFHGKLTDLRQIAKHFVSSAIPNLR